MEASLVPSESSDVSIRSLLVDPSGFVSVARINCGTSSCSAQPLIPAFGVDMDDLGSALDGDTAIVVG